MQLALLQLIKRIFGHVFIQRKYQTKYTFVIADESVLLIFIKDS